MTDTFADSAFQSTLPARGATVDYCISDADTWRFQSTLPARGATGTDPGRNGQHRISIHAPRTGSDDNAVDAVLRGEISIHAPRTGSDACGLLYSCANPYFNPRSPHGERRFVDAQKAADKVISIHAPRTGSDESHQEFRRNCEHFNPRSPHGERHKFSNQADIRRQFQSTLPARGATAAARRGIPQSFYFNPRSPHGERQTAPQTCTSASRNFNPRSPHGERRTSLHQSGGARVISIHAPRTGSDSIG